MKWHKRMAPVMALVAALLVQAGCTLPFTPQAEVFGVIKGQSATQFVDGKPKTVTLAATITCNSAKTTARADGSFTLHLDKSKSYACAVSEAPAYVTQTITITAGGASKIILNLGASSSQSCTTTSQPMDVECPGLLLQTGSVRGAVTYTDTLSPATGATVKCAEISAFASDSVSSSAWTTGVFSGGSYTVQGLVPGHYVCSAKSSAGDIARKDVTVTANNAATANFLVCDDQCDTVHYHGGLVMRSDTVYLIYWLPSGHKLDPNGDDASFKAAISQYFTDVNGSSFYGLLTQYWDYAGAIQNSVHVGGSWTDTAPYQRCDSAGSCTAIAATQSDPLHDDDIQAEIKKAEQQNPSWHASATSEFFVFTGLGAEECFTSAANADCTFQGGSHGFCGYHANYTDQGVGGAETPVIYAYIPDHGNPSMSCTLTDSSAPTPHNNAVLDSELSTISHEHFESVSDPVQALGNATGWFDDSSSDNQGEIGDKCDTNFGDIGGDGANITLNGHRYLLQKEWSNKAGGCSFS